MNHYQTRHLFFQEQVTGLLRWPPFDETLSIIALALAFSIFIIAYFAGGRLNRSKITFSILLASIIGFFSMPLFIKLWAKFDLFQYSYGVMVLITIMMIYIAALAVSVYEIIVVTAKEALPQINRG